MIKAELTKGMVFELNPGTESRSDEAKRFLVIGIRRDAERKDLCAAVALISLGKKRSLPFVMNWEELSSQLATGLLAVTNANAELLAVRSLSDVPARRRNIFSKKMTANKALIQPVLDLGWGAFVGPARGAEIHSISTGKYTGKSCSASWVRSLLIAYWRSGDNDLALGPDYTNCGAPSRAERRRRASKDGAAPDGLHRPGPRIRIVPITEGGSTPTAGSGNPGRGGCAISPAAELLIQSLIEQYLRDGSNKAIIRIADRRWKSLPWKAIRDEVVSNLRDYPHFASLRPSRRQVTYIGKKSIDLLATRELVFGPRETNLNNRAESGDYRDVSQFPGHRYEIDISVLDIQLVDDLTSLPIGKVFVIYVVDRFTGMIAGVYVTTDDPDFAHIGRALHAAYSNKVEWCRSIGLEIGAEDWLCEGKCEEVVADNAQLATKDGLLIAEHTADLGLSRPYQGDDKPQVETSFMLTEHGVVHGFGYGVSKGPKERATEDPTKSARISVRHFTRELVRWVVYVANHRALPIERALPPEFLKTRKKTSPYEFWKWSMRNIGGALKVYVPALMMPRLLKRTYAKMTEQGLLHEGLLFDRPDDELFQRNKRLATCAGRAGIEVYFDELTTRQVYIAQVDSNEAPLPCPLSHLSRDYADLTFKEVAMAITYRQGLHLATEMDREDRQADQRKAQRAASEADYKKIKAVYGGLKGRNKAANAVDKQTVRAAQAKADNLAQTDFIHGPAKADLHSPINHTPTTSLQPKVRPSFYE